MEIKFLDTMGESNHCLLECCFLLLSLLWVVASLTSYMTFAYLKIIFPTPLKVWGAWNFLLHAGALVEVLKKFLKKAGLFV